MPAGAAAILDAVRKLARQGLAAELRGGDERQPLAFVDVYRTPTGTVAHAIHYGDGLPQGFRLKVASWAARGKAQLYSPYLAAPVALKAASDEWFDLPASFGRYCAIRFA